VLGILAKEAGLEHMEAENFGEVLQSHSKESSDDDKQHRAQNEDNDKGAQMPPILTSTFYLNLLVPW
jgi:hypothetical protein